MRDRIVQTLVIAGCLAGGCAQEAPKAVAPREIGDKVTRSDLETFFQVIDDLPDKKLPELPPLFKPAPSWDDQRTLPVNELVREESDELEKQWSHELLCRHLSRDRLLERALSQRISMEQFVGLIKTIGTALARNAVRPGQDLANIIEEGKKRVEGLGQQTQRFNQLKPDERHTVLMTAMWIARLDCARRLRQVPPENRAMAKAHLQRLKTIFPKDFQANPFDAITDQIEELGMSFQELPQTGLDAEIEWTGRDVVRGADPPDVKPRESTALIGTPTVKNPDAAFNESKSRDLQRTP